jgi:hypothetical protein
MASTLITAYLGSGLFAARPVTPAIAAGTVGVYWAKDTQQLYAYDSTNGWSTIGGSIDLFGPPLAASFTLQSPVGLAPATSLTDISGAGMQFYCGQTVNGNSVRLATQAVPGATWTMTARLRATMAPGNYRALGLGVTDGTKIIGFANAQNTNGVLLDVDYFTDNVTFSSAPYSFGPGPVPCQYEYLRIKNDGTNLIFYVSTTGRGWVQVFSALKGAFLGAITRVGLYAAGNRQGGTALGDDMYILCPYFSLTTP